MARRFSKAGRPRKDGKRTKSGRISTRGVLDAGTEEIRTHRTIAYRGILALMRKEAGPDARISVDLDKLSIEHPVDALAEMGRLTVYGEPKARNKIRADNCARFAELYAKVFGSPAARARDYGTSTPDRAGVPSLPAPTDRTARDFRRFMDRLNQAGGGSVRAVLRHGVWLEPLPSDPAPLQRAVEAIRRGLMALDGV